MGDACCAVELGDFDPAEVYHHNTIRARKAHACDECNRPIQVGEAYERVEMLGDGAWSHWKTCWFCAALVRDYCGGVQLHGGLAEVLWDCLDYDLIRDEFRGEDDE